MESREPKNVGLFKDVVITYCKKRLMKNTKGKGNIILKGNTIVVFLQVDLTCEMNTKKPLQQNWESKR